MAVPCKREVSLIHPWIPCAQPTWILRNRSLVLLISLFSIQQCQAGLVPVHSRLESEWERVAHHCLSPCRVRGTGAAAFHSSPLDVWLCVIFKKRWNFVLSVAWKPTSPFHIFTKKKKLKWRGGCVSVNWGENVTGTPVWRATDAGYVEKLLGHSLGMWLSILSFLPDFLVLFSLREKSK